MQDTPPPSMLGMVMDDDDAEKEERRRLCLHLSGDAATRAALLCDAAAHHDDIVQQHRVRFVELSQIERQVIEDINERLPTSAHIAPFALLPPAIWESELEPRLMSWGLVSIHPHLNLYLPQSDAGNAVLYLPAAPASYPDSYTEGALREVRRIIASYEEACGPAPDAADEDALDDWLEREEEARLGAVEEILMLAEFLGRRLFGNEIVERHEGLFGKIMKEAMGFPSGLLLDRV